MPLALFSQLALVLAWSVVQVVLVVGGSDRKCWAISPFFFFLFGLFISGVVELSALFVSFPWFFWLRRSCFRIRPWLHPRH